MSLLLKLREWVSLDEAMVMATNEGIFPIEYTKTSFTADAISARWQLILSYSESNNSIRVFFALSAFTGGEYSASFIPKIDDDDVLDLNFYNEFTVAYKPTHRREGHIYVEDLMAAKVDERHPARKVYWESENGYSAYTWDEVVASSGHDEAYLKLKTESLLQLFARAKEYKVAPRTDDKSGGEARLPAKTAATFYKEYKSMAIAIAHLSKQKWADHNELAEIVLNACANAGQDMPVAKRTIIDNRLNKG
jgi:hypothetical protein